MNKLKANITKKRSFEKSGFVDPEKSYYVPLDNVTNADKDSIKTLIDNNRYFSIFAPRQSGKTTFFRNFCLKLEKDNNYIPVILSFQICSSFTKKDFYQHIQKALYQQLINRLTSINCQQLIDVSNFLKKHKLKDHNSFYILFEELNVIIKHKKIIIIVDEFDGTPENEIANFLLTLRELYQNYKNTKHKALYSVGLIGIRNVTNLTIGGVSPFNIADHIEFPPFNLKNIFNLYAQYKEETNQAFLDDAVLEVYNETSGQPWLVNRIASIATLVIKPDINKPIDKKDIQLAVKKLCYEDNNHFENLIEKALLYKNTIAEIINKNEMTYNRFDSAQAFLKQHGIIKISKDKVIIANPIYKKLFSELVTINNSIIKKKIFISYCHHDKIFLDVFVKHLNVLKYKGIDFWYDKNIQTGDKWLFQIQENIAASQIAVCLISSNYFASDFIREVEIPEILYKHEKEGMRLLPVLISKCAIKNIQWLNEIQIFPNDKIPIDELNFEDQERKIITIVDEIGEIL